MRLQKDTESNSTEVADHDDRIHNMSQHLKNVKQELTHNLVWYFNKIDQYFVLKHNKYFF